MSTRIMALCWPLQMQPTQKAVLVSLADNANDQGECWPSITTICERTCLGKTAVISAIKALEQSGLLEADRSNGRHTRYLINVSQLDLFDNSNRCARRAGARDEPVRQTDQCATRTGAADGPNPSASRTGPVRQADTNRQEPSRTKSIKSMTPSPSAPALPDWIDPAAWTGFAEMRKRIRAPLTERAVELTIKELAKFRADGVDANDILDQSTRNGWRGVFPIKGDFQRGPPGGGQPMGKQMQGVMALEELKNGARERQRLAAGGGCDGAAEALLPLAGPDARR